MDTVIAGTVDQAQDFDAIIRNAQDEFLRAAEVAGIAGDPAEKLFRAFTTHLTALRAVHFSERQIASQRIDALDRRLLDIGAVQDNLNTTATTAIKAAQAEIDVAHAQMGRAIVQSIATEVKTQMRAKARATWVMSIVFAAGLMLLAGIAGVAYGYQQGGQRMARSLQGGNYIFDKMVTLQGLQGLIDWKTLMAYNSIVPIMKQCHGDNISIQRGRKACNMTFWITSSTKGAPLHFVNSE